MITVPTGVFSIVISFCFQLSEPGAGPEIHGLRVGDAGRADEGERAGSHVILHSMHLLDLLRLVSVGSPNSPASRESVCY